MCLKNRMHKFLSFVFILIFTIQSVSPLDMRELKRVSGSLAKAPKQIFSAIREARFKDSELRLGGADVAFVHQMPDELSKGYEVSEAMVEPIWIDLALALVEDYLPEKISDIYNDFKSWSPEVVFGVDFMLLVKSVVLDQGKNKEEIAKALRMFPNEANKLMARVSRTHDPEKRKQQGKPVLSEMAKNGPSFFYDKIPNLLKKFFEKLKFPIRQVERNRIQAFRTSKVASQLYKIANESRSLSKYSQRTKAMKGYVDLIKNQGKVFNEYDKKSFMYWIAVHIGEWKSRVITKEQAQLKKPLLDFLSTLVNVIKQANFSSEEQKEITRLKKRVEENDDELAKLALLPFPEETTDNKKTEKLEPKELMDHFWSVFLLTRNKYYLSMPAPMLGPIEISFAFQAIMQRYDRDLSKAVEAYKESTKGKKKWEFIEKAKVAIEEKKEEIREFTKEEYSDEDNEEELREAITQMYSELNEKMIAFKNAAGKYPYLTFGETLEMNDKKETSVNDRLVDRLVHLRYISDAKNFNKMLRKKGLTLTSIGFDFAKLSRDIKSKLSRLDKKNPHFMAIFASESAQEENIVDIDSEDELDNDADDVSDKQEKRNKKREKKKVIKKPVARRKEEEYGDSHKDEDLSEEDEEDFEDSGEEDWSEDDDDE